MRQEYPPGIGNCDVYYPGPKAEMPAPIVWDDVDLPTEPPLKARVMNRETPTESSTRGPLFTDGTRRQTPVYCLLSVETCRRPTPDIAS